MVDTRKFSDFADGGDLSPNETTVGIFSGTNTQFNNPFPLLSPGNTAARPIIAPAIYYRLRYNTELQAYEYYNPVSVDWIQLTDSGTLVEEPFIVYTASPQLPDSFNLGALSTGILKQQVIAGISEPMIALIDIDYYGPGMTGYLQAPAGFKDVNGNIVLQLNHASSAVNYLIIDNSSTGGGPLLAASGSDSDINFTLMTQGLGQLVIDSLNPVPLEINSGTALQHTTNISFPNTANTVNVSLQDASGTLAFLSDIPAGSPSALTKTDDTNVTLTLGGSPSVALLAPASLTLGWTGVLACTRGGTGINNGSNTLTLAGTLATVGSFNSIFTMTGTTNVTFPTSGTLATTSQLPTPAALTNVDDTNVILSLAGNPATSLLQAVSITAGWSGQLSVIRGGTGIGSLNQGDILYASASNTLSALAKNTSATTYLSNTGTSNNPAWSQVNLSNGVTGNLPVTNLNSGTSASITTFWRGDGTWATPVSTGVTSVSGTANRITSTGGTTPVIDISASYVGQSSITTLGTIGTGTWQGTRVSGTFGGTGINNGASTFTMAGSHVLSGAFTSTFTFTNTTNVTFPTSGTLASSSQVQNNSFNFGVDTGTADDYAVTLTPAPGSITTGAGLFFIAANTNLTTTPGVHINGSGGAIPIVNNLGASLVPGDIQAGKLCILNYNANLGAYLLSNPYVSQVKISDVQENIYNFAEDTGVVNNYIADLTPVPNMAPANLTNGISIICEIANNNTGISNLTVNGFTAPIYTMEQNSLVGGELLANTTYLFIYNTHLGVFFLANSSKATLGNASAVSLSFTSTSGIIGTTTSDDAAAGSVGEFISSSVANNTVSLISATAANATSINLTAGDWDVWGNVTFFGNTLTISSLFSGWISSASASQPSSEFYSSYIPGASFAPFATAPLSFVVPQQRVSLSATTDIYLSVYSAFTTSTMTAGGVISARRIR